MLDVATAPKAAGSYDRCVSLETTLSQVPQLRAAFGITRVGDTTRLDRIGIPTFCAIVPRSPDLLGVYNGKGTTTQAAVASAVFEAAERQVAAAPTLPIVRESVSRICERLDLDRLGIKPSAHGRIVDCVEGVDLLSGHSMLVPLAAVQHPWPGERIFSVTTTNGLASGNTLIEATYHAVCELVERHVWSLYHARCVLLPLMLGGAEAANLGFASELRIPSGDCTIDLLADRIRSAGLRLRVMFLDEPDLPCVMLASIVECESVPPMSHIGLGCSLSPAHAAIRAITEAVQSRATDIQGAREDILHADDPPCSMGDHGRRVRELPKNCWFYDVPAPAVDLCAIPDNSSRDLAEDLRHTLKGLGRAGVTSVTIVDLSFAAVPVNVVRAIVPELETMCADGRVGLRVMSALNPFSTNHNLRGQS